MARTLSAHLEAVLFAAGEPLSVKRLMDILEVTTAELAEAAATLDAQLADRGIALIRTDTDLELRTVPEAADVVKKFRESELARDLGKASLETLAIILYKNGATRSDIDWVRGVNSTAALRTLLLRGLIERVDDPTDKRRAKYLPTIDALAHLGVNGRESLPRYEEFSAALMAEEAKAVVAAET